MTRQRNQLISIAAFGMCVLALVGAFLAAGRAHEQSKTLPIPTPSATPKPESVAGTVLSQSATTDYTTAQVLASSKLNYAALAPIPLYGVRQTEITYRSYETDGTPIVIYARVYQPIGRTGAPILGFAPGTTGIGDACAPSLENPAKSNWGDYQSHMLTYAGQGYASVITDYEGMRDPKRIEHYMVGEMEGRAVLDSVRALINLGAGNSSLDTNHIYLAGYSQGGHAAFWADQIAPSYAPQLHLAGIIGFGPVMDVGQTLADVTHGANINWFGPYLLVSYGSYYGDNYNPGTVLLPRWTANLTNDVLAHCIDTDISFWGINDKNVYTPEFISALATNLSSDPAYHLLAQRLADNQTGSATTITAKLINGGAKDNVVLPAQQTAALGRMCKSSSGPVSLHEYAGATHYNTMSTSLKDTLAWMKNLTDGGSAPSTCPAP